ncbi:helix-turn-helix domain-containing protein [Mycobacteroides abscessus]|uniref:helix-turn-helix domain-containing protein n=1 Tax=Mycobacteroides abscessus TaxID=36809 RepID=UPI0021076696|nr:helix-turn-helix transcriptional regulator [Mycobacteroides abscessus]
MPKERSGILNPEWVRIGATLRMARELRGYKPDPFASAIGISRPYLANIEAGRKKLTNVILARAARALDVEQIAIMRPTEVK